MKKTQFRRRSNPNSELAKAANQQIGQILTLLNVDFHETPTWITACCPVHHGDNRTAFNWNVQHDFWTCRTHHCELTHGKTIVDLVAAILNTSKDGAIEWLTNHIDECELVKKNIKTFEERVYAETCLQKLLKTDFYAKKGYSSETLGYFEHGLAEADVMAGRVVFPIRNHRGLIVGFSGRWAGAEEVVNGQRVCVKNGKIVPKWLHTSFKKSEYLYNFYRAKDFGKEELILVESIGNCMRWFNSGFKNAIACLGSSLSQRQAEAITSTTKKIVLAFDHDPAGKKASTDSFKRLEHYVDVLEIFPPENKDWADLTDEEVKSIYEKAQNQSVTA